MRYLLTMIITMTGLMAQEPPALFQFNPSQNQAFYFFTEVSIDSNALSSGDWIAAFNGDICVGARSIDDCDGVCDVPAMIEDGNEYSDGYLQVGDIPSFMIFDASENLYYSANASEDVPAEFFGLFIIDSLISESVLDPGDCISEGPCSENDGCGNYEDDCQGSCGGDAFEDECGVCNGDNSLCSDCAGIPNGNSWISDCGCVPEGNSGDDCDDCTGEPNGSAEEDACGVCEGDDSSCTGCTNVDADNFDAGNIIDDGNCDFSVPSASNLEAESGPGRIFLNWDAPEDDFQSDAGYQYEVYSDGEYVKSTNAESTQVTGLDDEEYCFTVLAIHNEYGEGSMSNSACATPETVFGPTWRLQLVAEIDSWDQFENTGNEEWLLEDVHNYLGVAADGSWGYDPTHDIPEPATSPGNYISLFFDHPEWSQDGWNAHFTEDIVLDDDDFFSTNLTQWNGTVTSDVTGRTEITFLIETGQVPGNYEMYVELDGDYHRIHRQGDDDYPTTVSFYMNGSGQQDFSVYIGNIVPQAPDNLVATGNYATIDLEWDEDGDDLNDIGNRYPATSYNVYRDDEPADPNGNDGIYAPGNGPGGCGGLLSLLTGYNGQTNSEYHDDADLYEAYPGEGLLQESTYSYTVTGSNLAGESSYGHTVRNSGGSEEYFDGRDSRATATTDSNIDPVVRLSYVDSPTTEPGQNNLTNIEPGLYEIPHNFNPDANRIEITVDGSDSNDDDYPYQIDRYSWTQTEGNEDLEDIEGTDTHSVTFTVDNPNGGDDKSYTWNLHVETDHPVKSYGECGDWGSELDTHEDELSLTVTIQSEPNAEPIASHALDLIRDGDGNSVITMFDYDDSDFNDYDGNEQVWYEPHNGSIDTNNADLWFSADDSSDPDDACVVGDFNPEGTNTCDHQTYSWWITQGSLAGFSYDDLNDNGTYEFGEPYTVVGGDEIYEDTNLGDWDAEGPASERISTKLGYFSNSFDPSSFYGLEPEVYEHDGPIDHNGFYGYNGLCHGDNVDDELCGGGRDLHLSLDSGDDATGEDDQEVYILTMKVTDVYGASDNVSLLLLVRDERNDAPVANEHRLQPDWIIAYGDDDREVYVDADCDNLGGHDSDDDDLIYDWTYNGPSAINLDEFDSNYDHASGSGDILDATADLGVGIHEFTFTITDPYGASSSASTVFTILDEPASEPGNITITHTALKHTIIEVSENILPEYLDDCHGEVYNGADWNTGRLDLFRESGNDGSGERELIARWYDDDGDFSGELEHIDETLSAETDFTYTLETVNSDEDQDLVSLVSSSTRTHDRPEVEVLTPNGAEIRSVGDNFDVDFITYFDRNNNDKYDEGIDDLTNGTYIAKIDVIYLADGLNEEEGVNSDGELQSSFNGFNEGGCSNSQLYIEEEQEGFDGDCSGYAQETTFIDASSPEECQSIADSTSNANWAGFYCDAEMHCVENGCYRSYDGTEIEWQDSCSDRDHDDDSDDDHDDEGDHPDCVDDCVGIDSIDGENIDSFCAWFNGLTDCLDDCDGDEDVEMAASFCSCYSETMDEDLCSLIIDDCHAGDATLNYEISDNDGLEVNYDAKVRIRVHDVGDYNGNNSETHEDDSDSPFTMAAHTISKEYSAGWHLVGTPVVPFDDYLFDNFGESLGNWGEEWVTFDVTGAYDNLTLSLSEGYYLALADDNTLVQHGDPVIADPDCNDCDDNDFSLADIDLDKGWNLIANPLVNKVDKETFVVEYEGEELLFEDAVDAGWIAPTIYGWFENSYSPVDRIMPFGGYFVNTSRSLSMKVRPHLFDDGELTRKNDEMIASVIDIKARDISGLGVGDFISVGLLENASNEFVYGEDEYDLPRSAYSSMGGQYIDLKVGFDMIRDMKSLDYEDYQVWNVSITTEKINSDIELSWSDASSFNNNLYLVVNDQSINMNEQSSINISTSIDKISIVAGNINAFLNPVPVEFGLSSAYPNPFNPTTNMSLALNKEGFVSMSVYNVRGQVVEVLLDRNMQPGYHNVVWNADGFSSGMYFVKVENGSNTAIQKLMLLK